MSASFTQVETYVEPNPNHAKTIDINVLLGRFAVLTYTAETTVGDLKDKIFNQIEGNRPTAQQRFISKGRILEDKELVVTISGNGPIHLVWQNKNASQTES